MHPHGHLLLALLAAGSACNEAGDDSQDAGDDTGESSTGGPLDSENGVFVLDRVIEASITLPEASWASLEADPYEYVPATLVFDGVTFEQVGVRLKSHIGSFRDLSGKASFKVDLNRYDERLAIGSLERLNLNNMVQDTAKLHELLAYHVWRLGGVATPRVGYVWLTVNGEVFGLYANVEVYDDAFLERNWEDGSGTLYDGDYRVWFGGRSQITMLDLEDEFVPQFQQDEGPDVGRADLQGLVDALDAASGTSDFMATVGALVDLEELASMWAGEVWTGHIDSYSFNKNNYRVYFDPCSGLAQVLPWDPDWAFTIDTPMTSISGRLTFSCRIDPSCHAIMTESLATLEAAIAATDLEGEVDAAAALVEPWLAQDPRLEGTVEEISASQDALRDWIHTRSATLASGDF
jgi:hypothetical protein